MTIVSNILIRTIKTIYNIDRQQAYFCAKCKHKKTDAQKAIELSNILGFKLWIPEKNVSYDFPKGAKQCKKAIDKSKIIICQTPIGRDCAWELGYAVAQKKPIYVIGKFDKEEWMTKLGNISYVKD